MSSSSTPANLESSNLPIKPTPGDYGLPFFGPIKARLDYFYYQGKDAFFRAKVKQHKSTVFRTNMPLGLFIARNPRVVAVLDSASFSVLFDTSKVKKRDVLDSTFMPSVAFTGGHRACAYLDPSEPAHSALKQLFLSLLSARYHNFIPLFLTFLSSLFVGLEDELSKRSHADFNSLSEEMSFGFIFKLYFFRDPPFENGPQLVTKWLFLQRAPLITLGLKFVPNFLEDLLLHTFPLPFSVVKSDYEFLYKTFRTFGASILDEAEKLGIERDEACHNLIFMAGFNAFGGMKALFPGLIRWVGSTGESLHRRLVDEIRTVVRAEGGVTFSALEKMSLTKSVVYESLRIDPPVPFQYGKAKDDMVVRSHDWAFEIKKGEMIFGYQPFATKDPRVFVNPEDFVGDRFVGEGEKLLKYVYWSNGRETEDPAVENKQCPGKDLVVLMCRVMLVEFFLRYDTFVVEVGELLLGSSVTTTALTKATWT